MLTAILVELAAFTLFGAVSFAFPDRKDQALLRGDILVDVLYFLASLLVYSKLIALISAAVHAPVGLAWIGRQPLWLQAGAVMIVYDGLQYGLHRWFHGDALWPYHAIHHSAEEIDILTGFRTHPMNFIVYTGVPTVLLLALGFSPAAFLALGPINFLMSALTHANLNWSYGPFRYVVASPMFHRWHHAIVEGSQSRNFSPNFPVWDLMFGTFHMPRGERPVAYGAPGTPRDFLGQMAHPFASLRLRKVAPGPISA